MKLHIKIYVPKNLVSYNYTYKLVYVGFISICNGIIDADAMGLPVLFTDCTKVIASSGVSSYLRIDLGDGTT